MRNIAFLLALALLGNAVEAKCTPGDDKCLSETSDDEALLQSRTVVEDEEDSMEDSVVEEMENEDSVVEEMGDSEEDMWDSEYVYQEELDWRDMLTEEGVAFMDTEEANEGEFQIEDEAAELEDSADEVEDSSEETEVEEDRGGKGWKRIKKAVKKVRKAIPSFRSLWSQITRKVKGMNSFPSCGSVNDCKNKLLKGPKKLLDRIAQEAGKSISGVANRVVGKASGGVQKALGRAKGTVKQVMGQANNAMRQMSNTIKSMRGHRANLGSMCTPRGLGFWSFAPTDCGAFNEVVQLVRGRGSLHNAIRKFASCAAKRTFGVFWTPFIAIKVSRWCIPSFIKKPIEVLVGTLQWAFSGKGPLRGVADAIKNIGRRIKGLFAGVGFLQEAAAVVGSTLHNDTSRYSIDSELRCHGSDFSATIGISGGITWAGKGPSPKAPEGARGMGGSSLSGGVTFIQGCYKRRYFNDVSFHVGGSTWVAGAIPDLKCGGCKSKFGAGVGFGFKIGRPKRTAVSWGATVTFQGLATVLGVKGDVALGFDVLPGPGLPKGFSFTPKMLTMLDQQRQEEIDAAVAQHDNNEDRLHAGMATMLGQLENLDLEDMLESRSAMSAIQAGATAMKEKTEEALIQQTDQALIQDEALIQAAEEAEQGELAFPIVIEKINVNAGLKIDFCLTCLLRGGPIY